MTELRDVFISYSQPDRACAYEMAQCLEARGITCWIAPRDITPAADWAAEIMDAISAARAMILVFSASSNHSPQVRREVERAVNRQLSVLPFRIEDVLPSKSLEYFLSTQHWLDAFPPPREPHYERLCSHLQTRFAAASGTGAEIASAVGTPAALPMAHGFPHAELQHVEAQLAPYIGPLAKHLVKQAALRATCREDLIARLAVELDTEKDRREFARRCIRMAAP